MIGERKLPVIFWIHGGSYFLGSGSEFGPAYLLEKDVILVTINYRLGILGKHMTINCHYVELIDLTILQDF